MKGAAPVPIPDLLYVRGSLGSAWTQDSKGFVLSTNLTGRFNLWYVAAEGAFPTQLTQSDDRQMGVRTSPDGAWVVFESDRGGAEIFAEETRKKICPNKVTTENWLAIHEELHRQGIASNATMLYGHIESIEDRLDHLIRLRESQERSPGYNAFIPLAFHPDGNELNDCGWTSGLDDLRTFAVARLMLNNFDHIKAYWMIQGLKVCQVALQFGADDMDGTHGSTDEEMIYHAAGTQSGQYVDDREFRRLIEAVGFVPVRRNTTYDEFSWDWAPPAPEVVAAS